MKIIITESQFNPRIHNKFLDILVDKTKIFDGKEYGYRSYDNTNYKYSAKINYPFYKDNFKLNFNDGETYTFEMPGSYNLKDWFALIGVNIDDTPELAKDLREKYLDKLQVKIVKYIKEFIDDETYNIESINESVNHKVKSALKWLNKKFGNLTPNESVNHIEKSALKWLNMLVGDLTKVVKGSRTFYVNKDGLPLFYYYHFKKNGDVDISYDIIWSFFESNFNMNDFQIREILKVWLSETYNLKGLTPEKWLGVFFY